MKKFGFALLALISAFSLTACSALQGLIKDFDAALYVRGSLELLYLGETSDDYYDIVDFDKSEAQTNYTDNMDMQYYDYFTYYFDIYPDYISEELNAEGLQLMRDIYSYSKFTADTYTKADDGSYSVTVKVSPMTLFDNFADQEYDACAQAFQDEYANLDYDAMTDEEYEELIYQSEEFWAKMIFDGLREMMNSSMPYASEETMFVRVYEDSDGLYTISSTDMSSIDSALLSYGSYSSN